MNLKSILKILKINESAISVVLGSIVIIVVGLFVINYFRNLEPGVALPDGINTENIALPTTHTVAKGETLWSISEKYYKTGYNWVDIAKENGLKNANQVTVGQELKIPKTPVIVVEQPKVAEKPTLPTIEGDSYAVVKGDHLWSIAVRAYGDGYKWVEIAKANEIARPNYIEVGQVLKLRR